ncbi:MAG: ABC transporter substrate-binding protein [Chloroflexi bacterium]|nr:ABC transporter substrate-binding protein [Chloroflexota bacterium]
MLERNHFVLSIVVCVGLSLVACQSAPAFECSDTIGCVTIAPNDPIRIGVLVWDRAVDQRYAFELAVDQRDKQLSGHPVELFWEDSRCSSEGGANGALKIVADPQVVGILGTTCTGSAATAAEIMSEAGLVMVSGLTTGPSLTSLGGTRGADWQAGLFRTSYNGATMAEGAATFAIQELGLNKAAIIKHSSNYSANFAGVFKQKFSESGGEIVVDRTVGSGEDDMHPVLTAVSLAGAQVVYIPLLDTEGIALITQIKDVDGLQDTIFIAGDALLLDNVLEAVGNDGIGIYFPDQPSPQGPASDELLSAFEAYAGTLPTIPFYVHAYDAANLLLNAIETVAVQKEDGTLHIGRQALRDALYATSDFDGVTGRLSCDEFGDCGVIGFNIVRLDDPAAGLEGARANVVYVYDPGGESND